MFMTLELFQCTCVKFWVKTKPMAFDKNAPTEFYDQNVKGPI